MILNADKSRIFFILSAVLSSIFLSSALTLTIYEMYLRKTEGYRLVKNRKETIANQWLSSVPRYKISDSVRLAWEIDPNPDLGILNNAGYEVNNLGFFDKTRNIDKSNDSYRIIAVGDSITESGWYSAYLEEKLNSEKFSNKTFEVWNFGVGGYSAEQFYHLIREKALTYVPDMIIVGLGIYELSKLPIYFQDQSGKWVCYDNDFDFYRYDVNHEWFLKYRVYRAYLYNIGKLRQLFTNNKRFESQWVISEIASLLKANDVELLLILFPHLQAEYSQGYIDDKQKLLTLLNVNKVNYIDMHDKYTDIGNPSWRESLDDNIHPSIKGHELIADELYKNIKKQFKK